MSTCRGKKIYNLSRIQTGASEFARLNHILKARPVLQGRVKQSPVQV